VADKELDLGEGMVVRFVKIAELREQTVNAQIMQPRHFERLTENIRQRKQLESLPYCYQPNGEGPVEIVSGHHRARAARAAGMTEIPVIVDTVPVSDGTKTARQIAANELHGEPDEQILAQMVASITEVDDLLATGLPEDKLPVPGDDDVSLGLPHAAFDWRLLTFVFLPHQHEQLESALDSLDQHSALIGIAPREDFEEFCKKVIDYGRSLNIRSVGAAVSALIAIATREIELAQQDGVKPDSTWVRTAELIGAAMPPDAAKVVGEARRKMAADGEELATDQPWRLLEFLAAEYLAGA
jgi:hypothetical protein